MGNKFLRAVYSVYAIFWFLLILLLIFPFVLLAMLFGQPQSGNTVVALSRFWSDTWMFMIGMWHRNIVEEPIEPGKSYVFVSNHISYLDIPLIFQVIRQNGIRILGKSEMAKIPVFGLLYRLAVIMVDRSSPENRAKSIVNLKKMLDQHISIFIFPEGTFNETTEPMKFFYDGAFRVAIETGIPIKPMVLLDSHKLMHQSSLFVMQPGRSRAVILPEIPTSHLNLEDTGRLKQQTYEVMEAALLKYRDDAPDNGK